MGFAAELRMHFPQAARAEHEEMLGWMADAEATRERERDPRYRRLTTTERAALKKLFAAIDTDGNGSIDGAEFETIVSGAGQEGMDVAQVRASFAAKVGEEGRLTESDFEELMADIGLMCYLARLLKSVDKLDGPSDRLLVCHAGQTSLWRLVPGGPPVLVRSHMGAGSPLKTRLPAPLRTSSIPPPLRHCSGVSACSSPSIKSSRPSLADPWRAAEIRASMFRH